MAYDGDPDLWWECNSSIQRPIKEAPCQREHVAISYRDNLHLIRLMDSSSSPFISEHFPLMKKFFLFFFCLLTSWSWRCAVSHFSISQTWSSLHVAWSQHSGDGNVRGSQTEWQITLTCCMWGNCFELRRLDKERNWLSYTLICLIDAFQKTLI